MKWVYRLQRRLGRNFGITNLMMYVSATMLAVFVLGEIFPRFYAWISLIRIFVLSGQVWRLVTFLFMPLSTNPIWVVIMLYFMYILGGNLEAAWGKGSMTLYCLFGAVGAIAAGLISGVGSNAYLYLSIFLAYAYMFPDATFMLFFIIPVKAKYLAFFEWALYAIALIRSIVSFDLASIAAILFSLINFFLFFGPQFWDQLRGLFRMLKRKRGYRGNNWDDMWR